jgi:hypothetical protein
MDTEYSTVCIDSRKQNQYIINCSNSLRANTSKIIDARRYPAILQMVHPLLYELWKQTEADIL